MSPTISVVMATCNGERYLAEQLQSLSDQTLPPDVLVISDDDSTDTTLDIATEFARTAPFEVVVNKNPNRLGYGENFLRATTQTKTDLVAFCDQDDVWHPEKLATCAGRFTDPDVGLAVHKATLIDADGKALGEHNQLISGDALVEPLKSEPWGLYSGFTMTFRRRLLDLVPLDTRGPDSNHASALAAHDRWVYFLAMCTSSTALIERPLALYRQHDRNLYGNDPWTLRSHLAVARVRVDRLAERTEQHRDVARHRARLLEGAVAAHANEWPILARAAAYWSTVADAEGARYDLYRAHSRIERTRQLLRNLSDGRTYRRVTDNGWRKRAIVRDALCLLPVQRDER